jgi:sulfatase modifying factor 1
MSRNSQRPVRQFHRELLTGQLLAVCLALAACGPDVAIQSADVGADATAEDTTLLVSDSSDVLAETAAMDVAVDAPDVADVADAATDAPDATVDAVDVADAMTATVCPDDYVAIAVNGAFVCAPDAPVWGIEPLSPTTFSDNGDGTVSDTLTKLMWQQGESPTELNWPAGQAYCDGLVLAGHDDWRLPTVAELLTTVDFTKTAPAIAAFFAGATPSGLYWSAVPYVDPEPFGAGVGWVVDGDTGGAWASLQKGPYAKNEQGLARARCVRASVTATIPVASRWYSDPTTGSAYDAWTYRTWRAVSSKPLAWVDATAYCASLSANGGGWRLPDIRELHSIVDRQQLPWALDPSLSVSGSGFAWSATPVAGAPGDDWLIVFSDGSAFPPWTDLALEVRCVRDACTPTTCDDANPCTADTCTPGGWCTHANLPDGITCSDGLACTADSCQAGICKGVSTCGVGMDCVAPAGECTCSYGYIAEDVDGTNVCAPDFPVWGVRPESPPPSWFTDNGDGTVSDSQSGMLWQKGDNGSKLSQSGAISYCQGLTLGGKSNWRLPTDAELQTLLDYGVPAPGPKVPAVFSASTTMDGLWTASPLASDPTWEWIVAAWWGDNTYAGAPATMRARCVNAPTPMEAPAPRFTVDAAAGTVLDAVTKLTWQRDDAGYWDIFSAASAYCAGLALGTPSSGWRLPTVVELESLVDRAQFDPCIDLTTFPQALGWHYWTSTSTKSWYVSFNNGSSGQGGPTYRVRCVRDSCPPTGCDDANACTTDTCAGACQHVNLPAGATCGTGSTCDGSGSCVGPPPPAGMVLIPSGTFWMGCNAAKESICYPSELQHKVTLSSYYMDLTETTVGQYKACVDAGVCSVPEPTPPVISTMYMTYPGLPNNPVNDVTWTQAQQYCKWRGAGFDLPTEAQWEMAARGSCEKNGSTATDPACAQAMRTYPWGEATPTCDYAVYDDGPATTGQGCDHLGTMAVGSKPAGDSPYGLHDMAGNLSEWNRDWYGDYSAGDQTDPLGPAGPAGRVVRGDAFNHATDGLEAYSRSDYGEVSASYAIGLRCSKSFP